MTTRDDPELGPVRLCPRCLEEWPLDEEFYPHQGDGFHSWCKACWSEFNLERRPSQARDTRRYLTSEHRRRQVREAAARFYAKRRGAA